MISDIKDLTKRQVDTIEKNLTAFEHNFGACKIVRETVGQGVYIFWPADTESYIQYCENISYADGWFYGCVQAFHKHSLFDEAYKQSELYLKYHIEGDDK